MSESMAFIGGVAVAGLAAILLLKGTATPLPQPNFAAPQLPAGVYPGVIPQQPPMYNPYGQPLPSPTPVTPNADERIAVERAKMENEMLKRENEQLKTQIQQIQSQIQTYNYHWQLNAQQNQKAATQLQQSPEERWWSSPIVWAVGGMALTIGGGVVVAGVLSLFSPKNRSTRTVQVLHPYNGPTPPLVPVRRAEFLPPRTETRRVNAPEYEDTY